LLRGNATKELEAVQQAAAEAGTLLETTPDLGKCVGEKAKNVSSNYSIFKSFKIMENCPQHILCSKSMIPVFQIPGAGPYF
jgi:hypothetical protein